MRIATQKEALPNDIESLIRRLGQELSCSICLSVFEDPTMTSCNHTFCRECIERAVTLTKRGSSIPCNQCPICKSKAPKRSLNPSAAAAKLCKIYEEIVRAYSEYHGGNDDWINETGVRGNEANYSNYGGVPLDNLSQLYPFPEKPNKTDNNNTLLTDLDEPDEITQLEDETTTQLTSRRESFDFLVPPHTPTPTDQDLHHPLSPPNPPSSPLIFEETQLTICDRLVINTQEIEKLTEINDSIDKELAELEKKLAARHEDNFTDTDKYKDQDDDNDKENYKDLDFIIKTESNTTVTKQQQSPKVKVIAASSKVSKVKSKTPRTVKRQKIIEDVSLLNIKGITTTGLRDEGQQIRLAEFSDKFQISISNDFQADVSHLVIPTGSDLIVKKRTMKYFEGILLGTEIISFDWIEACLKSAQLISLASFKVRGDEIGIKNDASNHPPVSTQIFSNYKFYLYGEFSQPPRDQLEKLIKFSGASLLTSVQDLSRNSVIIADPLTQFTFETDAQIIKKYPIVGSAWLLDSISSRKALEFHNYFIL